MTRIKKNNFKRVRFWLLRGLSLILSVFVVAFLVKYISYRPSFEQIVSLILFSLFFFAPTIFVFIRPKIALVFYLFLDIILFVCAIYTKVDFSTLIIPVWVLAIIALLIYEIMTHSKNYVTRKE